MAGFEAELIFRGLGSGEGESEPYYDEDRRADGISDIVDFFDDGDFNGRGDIRRLENQLREDYIEWLDEQSQEAWSEEQDSRITRWVRENYDPDEEAREAVAEENPDLDPDSDEFREAVEQRVNSMMSAQIDNALMDPANPYHEEAQDDWREDYYNEDQEQEWLEDAGLDSMSAIENNYNITWPYWTAGSTEGSRDADEIGESLKQVVGMPVKVSDNYHTAKREPGVWIVETDGSLDPDDDEDGGREIVSPPMPLDQALTQLTAVIDWANNPNQGNAYTNGSTGLHMGVSIPEKGGDVDYTKLILFMGDKYVLQKFGREANTYCKSALDNMQSRVKSGQVDPAKVLQDMRNGLNDLASVAVQGDVGTDKRTSAHIKPGYIEFRSPGGDYLAEVNVDMNALDSTMLRFARAMQIAGDPNAYRKEYAKKLETLLTGGKTVQYYDPKDPKNVKQPTVFSKDKKQGWVPVVTSNQGNDALKYFAQYAAGELPKAALKSFVKQVQQQRQGAKDITSGTDQTDQQERTTPIPGSTMDLAQQRAAAATQNATNPPWRDQLRNHMQTATQNVTNPLWRDEPQGSFTGRWLIRDTSTGQTLYAFGGIGNSQADANRYAAQWVQANAPIGTDMTEVEVVPEMQPVTEDAVQDLEQDLRKPRSYKAIDHVMRGVSQVNRTTPKKLHDRFVDKHGEIPDDWVKKLEELVQAPEVTTEAGTSLDFMHGGNVVKQKVYQTMADAGYKKVGRGADASVWTKDDGSVMKIITSGQTPFLKFYKFCRAHPDNPHLPRFMPIQGQDHAVFKLYGAKFLQASMEKLQKIRSNSPQEFLIWYLEDAAGKNHSWDKVVTELTANQGSELWKHSNQFPMETLQTIYKSLNENPNRWLPLYKTIVALRKHIGSASWDLHTDNAMRRSDGTVVITDPYTD